MLRQAVASLETISFKESFLGLASALQGEFLGFSFCFAYVLTW
jgi:hypothetical protein